MNGESRISTLTINIECTFGKKERKCNQILNEKCIYTQCDEGTSLDLESFITYIRHLRSVRARCATSSSPFSAISLNVLFMSRGV